jgi:RNA polymerase sigma factor (sigma-70 family)
LTDEQLLQRFVASREEPAFRALLLRHGPLVWGVCRRLLHDVAAAEDAFQDTFVTLARKADAIRQQSSLGSWLYGVAFRLASRTRSAAGRQRAASATLDAVPDPRDGQADITLREASAVLDQELGRLAEKYRAPLVLCYLEGKTHEEAARQLGRPLGTFKHRLEDGRRLLRRALERRGVALATVLTVSALTPSRAPAALTATTVRAALAGVSGSGAAFSLAGGCVGALLAHGGRWKTAAALLLLAGFLCTSVGQSNHSPALAAAENAPAPGENSSLADAAAAPKAAADLFGDPLPPEALVRMGTIRWRLPGLAFLAALPGDQGVVTASHDGSIRLWDGASGRELRRFEKPIDEPDLAAKLPKPDDGATQKVMTMDVTANVTVWRGLAPAVSADGKVLAQGSDDGRRVFLWNIATAKSLRTIILPKILGATPPALSRDGGLLAIQTAEEEVLVFDTTTGKELHRLGEARARKARAFARNKDTAVLGKLAFSGDGTRLVAAGFEFGEEGLDFLGRSYDLSTGKEFAPFKGPGKTFAFSQLSRDGSKLAWSATAGNGILHVVDTATGKEVCKIEDKLLENPMKSFALSADGSKLAGRLHNGGLVVWETASGKRMDNSLAEPEREEKLPILYLGSPGSTLAISDDGRTLFAATENGSAVQRYDLSKKRPEENSAGHMGSVIALAVAENGKTLTTLGNDDTLRRWSPETGKEIDRFPLPHADAAALSPDGKRCAYSDDKGVAIRDVAAQGNPIRLEGDATVSELAFSPDGKTLFGLTDPPTLRVWETETGKLIRRFDLLPEEGKVHLVSFRRSTPHTPRILAIAPDGHTLACLPEMEGRVVLVPATGDAPKPPEEDRTIYLWDTVHGKRIGKFEGPKHGTRELVFSPDGRLLAAVSVDRSITLWEAASGRVRRRIQGAEADGNPTAAFSPDGRTLALGCPDGAIRFRDVDTGKLLGRLSGHQGRITSLTYAADGQTLYSASSDTTILAWSLKSIGKPEALPQAELPADALDAAWAVLAEADAEKALPAIRTLVGSGRSIPFLAERTKPAAPADPALLTRLLDELDSGDFQKREKAQERLAEIGDVAGPALEKVLAGNPGLESRKRIEHVLDAILTREQPGAEVLRTLRAIEVLERIGSPAARQVLEKLANGAAGARQTKAARAAVDRLKANTSRAD